MKSDQIIQLNYKQPTGTADGSGSSSGGPTRYPGSSKLPECPVGWPGRRGRPLDHSWGHLGSGSAWNHLWIQKSQSKSWKFLNLATGIMAHPARIHTDWDGCPWIFWRLLSGFSHIARTSKEMWVESLNFPRTDGLFLDVATMAKWQTWQSWHSIMLTAVNQWYFCQVSFEKSRHPRSAFSCAKSPDIIGKTLRTPGMVSSLTSDSKCHRT